jgi:hypothetical protein
MRTEINDGVEEAISALAAQHHAARQEDMQVHRSEQAKAQPSTCVGASSLEQAWLALVDRL